MGSDLAHSGPVLLFCFFPALRALDFGTGFGDDVACDYFSCVVTCVVRVASVWLPSNLVDGDAIS